MTDSLAPALRVLTQNIRMADPDAVPGSADYWPDRAGVLADELGVVDADVIGTQEVLFEQIPVLDAALGATHDRLGYGREGGGRGEHNLLHVRRDRFEVLDWDQFWLSEEPQLIGSIGWGAHCPRICVWARVHDTASDTDLILAVTHLDHADDEARRHGAQLLAQRLDADAGDLPIVLMGDFNAAAGESLPWQTLTAAGFADAHDDADRIVGPDLGTFPDYREPVPGDERIDWILTRGMTVECYEALAHRRDGVWASDHTGVLADLRVRR